MAIYDPRDFYFDDTSPEYIESNRKATIRHAVCQDKKCCCNCNYLRNACVDKSQSKNYNSRNHWGKGGTWEFGYYLCSHPKVGLVFLGHQTDDKLTAKHGICPLYEKREEGKCETL